MMAARGLRCGVRLYYDGSGPLAQDTTVIFKRGEKFQAIVGDMAQAGVIGDPLLFKAIAVAWAMRANSKPGNTSSPPPYRRAQVMDMIAQGRVVVHKFTVPEGFTAREVMELLKNEPALEGDVPAISKKAACCRKPIISPMATSGRRSSPACRPIWRRSWPHYGKPARKACPSPRPSRRWCWPRSSRRKPASTASAGASPRCSSTACAKA